MDFYDEMAEFVDEILGPTSEDGLGQTGVELIVRRTTENPDGSWLPPLIEDEVETLRAAANGALAFADGTAILATDIVVVSSVPQLEWRLGEDYTLFVSVNGKIHSVVSSRAMPAAGTPTAVQFIIR